MIVFYYVHVKLSTTITIFIRRFFMKNRDIKEYAKSKGVRLWQIAEVLHINDGNFSRKLRKELSETQKQEIMKIIDDLAENEVVE